MNSQESSAAWRVGWREVGSCDMSLLGKLGNAFADLSGFEVFAELLPGSDHSDAVELDVARLRQPRDSSCGFVAALMVAWTFRSPRTKAGGTRTISGIGSSLLAEGERGLLHPWQALSNAVRSRGTTSGPSATWARPPPLNGPLISMRDSPTAEPEDLNRSRGRATRRQCPRRSHGPARADLRQTERWSAPRARPSTFPCRAARSPAGAGPCDPRTPMRTNQ